MDAIAKSTFETVAIEKCHEQLEVFFFTVMGRGGHQQEVPCQPGEHLAKSVTLRVLDLPAEERGRKFMGFVAYHEIPATIRCRQLRLNVLVARQLVQPGDRKVIFEKPIARSSRFQFVVSQDFERQVKAPAEFILPLFRKVSWANDETSLKIATNDQFLDQQSRHDRLSSARIVGQEESQRLSGQHGFVHGRNLMRQRIHE